MKLRLTRTVTQAECSWLDRDFREGEEVFAYPGFTYGSLTETGRAVSEEPDGDFFELPADALEEIKGTA